MEPGYPGSGETEGINGGGWMLTGFEAREMTMPVFPNSFNNDAWMLGGSNQRHSMGTCSERSRSSSASSSHEAMEFFKHFKHTRHARTT